MLGSLGAPELLIILAIVALIFGASRFTALGRSLGQGIREFRSEVRKPDTADEPDAAASTPAEGGERGNTTS